MLKGQWIIFLIAGRTSSSQQRTKASSSSLLHHSTLPAPAETAGLDKGSPFNSNHFKSRPQLNGPTMAQRVPAFMDYMKSFNGKPVPIPAQIAKPLGGPPPQHLLGQGLVWSQPSALQLAELPQGGGVLPQQ